MGTVADAFELLEARADRERSAIERESAPRQDAIALAPEHRRRRLELRHALLGEEVGCVERCQEAADERTRELRHETLLQRAKIERRRVHELREETPRVGAGPQIEPRS